MVFGWLWDWLSYPSSNEGKEEEKAPSSVASSKAKEVVGYVDTNLGAGLLSTLEPNLCTMMDLAFAPVDASGNIKVGEVANYAKFLALRGTDKAPKMLLSLGGATDKATFNNFRTISQSPALRSAFAQSCLNTCQQRGLELDGIDIDWEFPEKTDRTNYVLMLRAVKEKLKPAGKLLTIAVGTSNWVAGPNGMGGLDIPALAAEVDFIKLMTYDFHSNAVWDRDAGLNFNAPLEDSAGRDSIMNSLKLFSGAPSSKLILGLPLYGIAYVTSGSNAVNADYKQSTPSTGINPDYTTICALTGMTKVAGSGPQWTPYMYGNGLWISYDDPTSLAKKASLVNTKNLGGVMVWSLEKDDQKGVFGEVCYSGSRRCPFPLMRAINEAVGRRVPWC